MEYNALNELMSYYYFEFYVQCVLVIIMLINTIKSIKYYTESKRNMPSKEKNTVYSWFDFAVSVFVIIGMYFAIMFQGVISDISDVFSQIWFGKVLGLFVFVIALFIIQISLYLLSKKSIKRNAAQNEKN
ncbi:hypothetical protein [Fusibacter bizertensis]